MSELTLICEGCGAPVRRDSGGIYVTYGEINAHEAAMRDWRERHPEGQAITLADLDDHPGPIPWRSAHDACTQDGKGDRYEIDAARIGTWQALASWTAHLMEKNWLAAEQAA